MENFHDKERLKELQALPLDRKVGFTAARIVEWYNHYEGKVYVSFSGGKDSTVLLYLARTLYPEIKACFIDTGLEYPEIREFVKTFDNVDTIRPKISFKEVIETYGYPVIGKNVARAIRGLRTKPNGCRAEQLGISPASGKYGPRYDLSRFKYLTDAPFKISDQCCYVMKKSPANKYRKVNGLMPITGSMASESKLRETSWIRNGCNLFNSKKPISNPLSFWTEQDILKYIKLKNIPTASVYGDVIQDSAGKFFTTGCKRTGCVFCLFGINHDSNPNRIQRLKITHPKLHKYCLDVLGLREVMEFLKVPYEPDQDFFNEMYEISPQNTQKDTK